LFPKVSSIEHAKKSEFFRLGAEEKPRAVAGLGGKL
jgi:hypothetical protein